MSILRRMFLNFHSLSICEEFHSHLVYRKTHLSCAAIVRREATHPQLLCKFSGCLVPTSYQLTQMLNYSAPKLKYHNCHELYETWPNKLKFILKKRSHPNIIILHCYTVTHHSMHRLIHTLPCSLDIQKTDALFNIYRQHFALQIIIGSINR